MPAPKKYDEETMARAVRMYRDRVAEGGTTQLSARRQVGEMLGIKPATLRNWVRREDGPINDSDTSGHDGESLEAANARLRRENEILKTSPAFFAAAELDRQLSH